MNSIVLKKIDNIDINDKFFNSLKESYIGFEEWFRKKADKGEKAFVLEENGVQGFLYLKEECDEDLSINPNFIAKRRLKVGTFKINAHGTKLGERFIKIIIDKMFKEDYEETYVTIFKQHNSLIQLLEKYGFEYYGYKTTNSGKEDVYIKKINSNSGDINLDYPKIHLNDGNKYLLSIYPCYHTRMFPDSKLLTEKQHRIEDISVTNSIEKIYLSAAYGLENCKKGDLIVIYRTAEPGRTAKYSAVATSICVVKEIKNINSFTSFDEFKNYCVKHSVFDEKELNQFWNNKKYPYLIKFLYNIALEKRITRDMLINNVGIDETIRWTLIKLNDDQIKKIIELGKVNNNFISR
ncbi:MAG: hypothetical protein Q4C19_03245 [Clostridiaceae bacterium]|nr:hypothetical protein [Clostridiaceae bacterium]